MELSRPEYPTLLASLQPGQAVNTLNERMRTIGKLNTDIADWLAERRRIEDIYAEGLRKLARKQPPDESSDLGAFTTSWQKIVGATASLAESHHLFAQKIESDLEHPLRSFLTTNKEAQAMGNITGNLVAIADEIEAAQKKSGKLKDKGAKASTSKVAQAASDLDGAQSQWESQAPFVFEKLQEVDEIRVNQLRDILTQFQTHETDQAERNRATTEQCLNALLNVDTADEIKSFCRRASSGKPRPEQRHRGFRQSSSNTLSASVPTINTDDGSSQRSGSTQEQKPTRLGGLKRLGTVIGRRRQSFHPYGRASSPDRAERKSQSNLGILGGLSARRSRSKDARPSSEPQGPVSPGRPVSELPSLDIARQATSSLEQSRQTLDRPNGADHDVARRPSEPAPSTSGVPTTSIPSLQEPLPPIPSTYTQPPDPPMKDSEGFSVAPPPVDAISQAEQEALGENSGPQFKVDIRNAPIQEEDADAETAIANVANALRAQAAQPRKSGTIRGRRDVRNTVFVPSPEPPLPVAPPAESPTPVQNSLPSSLPTPPAAPSTPRTTAAALPILPSHSPFKPGRHLSLEDGHTGSDTQSIRSGRSLASSASTTVKHPEMHETGLNSSIVEIVSAWFEHGAITKTVVIGELAMVFNPADVTAGPFGTETLRLENFPVLEKVAPNPTFIDQITDQAGSYTVNLASVTKTQVAFKYQVHLEDSDAATHVPLLLSPAWKVEPLQTSVILTYSLNPLFALHGATSLTLRNLVLLIHLDGKASSCQSKPVGNLSREKSILYWRLGDVTLEPDQPSQQLRARFFTESEAKPGSSVEARWEISGADATALGSGLAVSQLDQASDAGAIAAAGAADPFADEDATTGKTSTEASEGAGEKWKEINMVKRIMAGTYTAV